MILKKEVNISILNNTKKEVSNTFYWTDKYTLIIT